MNKCVLMLFVCACAAACWGEFTWQVSEKGLTSLVLKDAPGARNLVNAGKSFGEIHLRTAQGDRVTDFYTYDRRGTVTEQSDRRFVRTWQTEKGPTLVQAFERTNDALILRVTVKNPTAQDLCVSDLGIQVPFASLTEKVEARRNYNRQECVNGGASWILWTPIDGIGTNFALIPDAKTSLQYMQSDKWFYIYAVTRVKKPEQSWRIPRSIRTMNPGAEMSFSFKLITVKDLASFPETLVAHQGVNIRVVPGMVIPRGEKARIAFETEETIAGLASDHPATTQIAPTRTRKDKTTIAEVAFTRLGENRINVTTTSGRRFSLDFFVTEDLETVIKKRAAFIVQNQQTKDKTKWYDGLYSLYHLGLGRALSPDFRASCHPFMVAGSDDPSNSKPVYISEKNVAFPNAEEIASLEYYEQNFVWGKLQRTDTEYPYPCGIYGSDNWAVNRSGRAGDYNSGGNGRERMWRTFDYVTHIAIYYNLYRIALENPSLVHYLDAKGYLRRAYLTAKAYYEVPYNIRMGNQWAFHGWCEWAYTQGNFHERYILDLIAALEREGKVDEANGLRREWEKKVCYMVYENPWPFGSEMFVDRTAFESSYYVGEYALQVAMPPHEMFWYDKNRHKWYSYKSYPQEPKEKYMRNQLLGNLALRGIYTTSGYNRCGTAWTDSPTWSLEYMTQMGGVALLDHATRFAEGPAQTDEIRWGYNSLLASWALVNNGAWRKGAAFDGAAGWSYMGFVEGKGHFGEKFKRGSWTVDGEIDHGFTGGVHGSACYLVDDPVFGATVYGGRGTADSTTWRVTPWDATRRTLIVPQQKRLEIRLRENGFAKGAEQIIARDASSFTLTLEKRTEAANQTIDFRNLASGMWEMKVGESAQTQTIHVKGNETTVSFPFATKVTFTRLSPKGYAFAWPKMGTVRATEGFWAAREATNRLVTAPSNIARCWESHRIDNFLNAAKKLRGEKHGGFRGIFFNDSDVYKAVEGMCYEYAMHPTDSGRAELDKLAAIFAGAQEPDGYIYTARLLGDRHVRIGNCRWYCDDAHELYCMGHLIECAVAYYQATGEKLLLNVARKAADMMDRTFGFQPGQIRFVPGHEEIELALAKLAQATGESRYLDLASRLLDMRGRDPKEMTGMRVRGIKERFYYQDHMPVRQQREIKGHAVRAVYLCCALVDLGVLKDDVGFLETADAFWQDIVNRKLHLTGGVGASHWGENFGDAYELPNESAYLETCAAIGHALFNARMFRRTGERKYLDLVERVAYNGFLSSVSIHGDEFFYPNPLASRGGYKRSKWFGCACCPPNVVRFVPQFINWTFAEDAKANAVYWNFFLSTKADLARVTLEQKTDYPWSGDAALAVTPKKAGDRFALKVRVPGWALGEPVPSKLYVQTKPATGAGITCAVNGVKVATTLSADGFLTIDRAWQKGDVVTLHLPLEVKRIRADARVAADKGRLAVERGPLVYCAEGVDNHGRAFNAVLPESVTLKPEPITIAQTQMTGLVGGGLHLIPYYAWNHRGAGELQTWFAEDRSLVAGNAHGIIVTASHTWRLDTTDALFDGKLPKNSADESIPRHSFWDRRGTEEWIELELPAQREVKGIEVYWFDDHSVHKGCCALPASWKVQSRMFPGLPWEDVKDARYTTVRDAFSAATFAKPITASAFRIKVKLQKGLSCGTLEVRVK